MQLPSRAGIASRRWLCDVCRGCHPLSDAKTECLQGCWLHNHTCREAPSTLPVVVRSRLPKPAAVATCSAVFAITECTPDSPPDVKGCLQCPSESPGQQLPSPSHLKAVSAPRVQRLHQAPAADAHQQQAAGLHALHVVPPGQPGLRQAVGLEAGHHLQLQALYGAVLLTPLLQSNSWDVTCGDGLRSGHCSG